MSFKDFWFSYKNILYREIEKKKYFTFIRRVFGVLFKFLIRYLRHKLQNKVLNLVVSKSGNTLETISNFNLILNSQRKNKNIIITENKLSFLNKLAKKLKVENIEYMKNKIMNLRFLI